MSSTGAMQTTLRPAPAALARLAALTALAIVAALVALAPRVASAQVDGWLPVQGALYDSDGDPVEGPVTLQLSLWDGETGRATELWRDSLEVTVDAGYFTVYLGQRRDGPDLDLGLFRDNRAVWLEVAVGDDEPLGRVPVVPAPFAALAGDARTLDGNGVDDLLDYTALSNVPEAFPPTDHEHDAAAITSGTLDPARVDAHASLDAAGRLDADAPDDLVTVAEGDARYLTFDAGGNADNLRTGVLDPSRYSAHDDLVAEGRLLLDDPEDVVSRQRGDARYSAIDHVHGAGQINAGVLDPARFSAFDDLQAEGRLDGDVDTDLLLRGDARRDFATSAHTHSAASIASGTLSTDRYDAYQDLAEAGRLNGNAAADLLTRAVGDERYLRQDVVPAIGLVDITGSTSSTSADTIAEFTVAVPAAGVLLVEVSGMLSLDANAGSTVSLFREANLGLCDLADSSGTCGTSWSRVGYQDADGALVGGVAFGPDQTIGFSLVRVVEVDAGPVTFFVNGRVQSVDAPLTIEAGSRATATFFPAGLSVSRP
jgi:hypothetical protein